MSCPLPHEFFARPSPVVAADLVGKIIWRHGIGGGRLVEVEAYLPSGDEACHAAQGKTARNAMMFGPPGSLYVHVSYGVHHLLNLDCWQTAWLHRIVRSTWCWPTTRWGVPGRRWPM